MLDAGSGTESEVAFVALGRDENERKGKRLFRTGGVGFVGGGEGEGIVGVGKDGGDGEGRVVNIGGGGRSKGGDELLEGLREKGKFSRLFGGRKERRG